MPADHRLRSSGQGASQVVCYCYHANMRSQLQQALSDIDRGIELFEQSVQGNLTRGERTRLAREAVKVRLEFDRLIADLLAELHRRHLTQVPRSTPAPRQAAAPIRSRSIDLISGADPPSMEIRAGQDPPIAREQLSAVGGRRGHREAVGHRDRLDGPSSAHVDLR